MNYFGADDTEVQTRMRRPLIRMGILLSGIVRALVFSIRLLRSMAASSLLHLCLSIEKKLLAEHSAAARAYDCWCLRLEGKKSDFLGQDQPYLTATDAPTPPSFPAEVTERVNQLQEDAKRRMPIPVLMQPPPPMQTEEAQKDREEYRMARRKQSATNMKE